MGKKSSPPAPDYTAAANAQAASSLEAANRATYANRPTQTTPWGQESWTQGTTIDPSTGQNVTTWNQNQTLSPQLQGALDQQMSVTGARSDIASGMLNNLASSYSQPVNFSSMTPMGQHVGPVTTGDTTSAQAQRDAATQSNYAAMTSMLDPQWSQSDASLETRLANQGITQGSDTYTRAMDDQARQRSQAYSQAQLAAINAGGTEAQRNQAMDLSSQQQAYQQAQTTSQADTQLRQQQISEALQERGFTLNEINSLLNGQQVAAPNMPTFTGAGTSQGANLLGAAQSQYGAATDAANASASSFGSTLGSVASIAGMFAMSDSRSKRVIKRIRTHPRGFGIYLFRYIGERGLRVGPVAQEVRRYAPDLVIERDGVLYVPRTLVGA